MLIVGKENKDSLSCFLEDMAMLLEDINQDLCYLVNYEHMFEIDMWSDMSEEDFHTYLGDCRYGAVWNEFDILSLDIHKYTPTSRLGKLFFQLASMTVRFGDLCGVISENGYELIWAAVCDDYLSRELWSSYSREELNSKLNILPHYFLLDKGYSLSAKRELSARVDYSAIGDIPWDSRTDDDLHGKHVKRLIELLTDAGWDDSLFQQIRFMSGKRKSGSYTLSS
ncbi:MAG: hypothetical protein ACXABY_11235 [Candidatus Thorarchaeota archaeon]|jgi:hypothetical protein